MFQLLLISSEINNTRRAPQFVGRYSRHNRLCRYTVTLLLLVCHNTSTAYKYIGEIVNTHAQGMTVYIYIT